MTQNELKRQAANAAMDYLAPKLTSEMILGIGTGSTANFFIELLGHYQGCFMGAVASSEASSRLLKKQGISIIESNDVESLAFYIDGADECNPNLEMIKGGGAALTREKIVAAATNQFICIADESKLVKKLGVFPLPVEVIPMARNQVIRALKALGGRPIYRQGCVTDNHCHIIDVHDLDIDNAPKLESDINQITGVVTNGLFARRPAEMLFLGTPDGVRIMYANMAGNQF